MICDLFRDLIMLFDKLAFLEFKPSFEGDIL